MTQTPTTAFRFTPEDLKLLGDLAAEMEASKTQTIRRALIALRKMLDEGYRFSTPGEARQRPRDLVMRRSGDEKEYLQFLRPDDDGRLEGIAPPW